MTWLREGYCCKCGDCCEGNPKRGTWPDKLDGMCPLLGRKREDGTRLCIGHGKHPYYLQGCVVWPSIPAHTLRHKRCTYSWRWVDAE